MSQENDKGPTFNTNFPDGIEVIGEKLINLRYGENPHQQAALYFEPSSLSPLKNLRRVAGRELSLMNVTDINAGIESVRIFEEPTSTVIKHNTPCGIALGDSPSQSLARAIESDPESAFGGVVVSNVALNLEAAEIIAAFKGEKKSNVDIVAVPAVDDEAIQLLRRVRKTMGVYTFGEIPKHIQRRNIKWIDGGFIVQTADDDIEDNFSGWEVVTGLKPTEEQLAQMKTAWKFISRIRSNAVIVVDKKIPMTRGIGSGQTSRVRATKIALEQAGDFTESAILASDSFFPFDDSVKMAASRGIGAIVQQGGSVNDKRSIEAANHAGLSMVFTHHRAFWH